jgi:UDPglucose--hexose-1-phosphate uridylyltransferase
MGILQKPVEGDEVNGAVSQLHFVWYPPLLRSASVRKFLVGCVIEFTRTSLTVPTASNCLPRLSGT